MTDSAKNEPQNDLARFQRSPGAMAALQNAQHNLRSGRPGPALAVYHSLVQQFPGVAELWAELGSAAMGDLEFALANQAYERAAELASANAPLLVNIGTQFYHLRQLDQAFACLKRAVEVDPSSVHARLTLASWLERTRRLDEAWECVETCLAQHPKDGRMLYFKAFLLQCKGNNKEAETALRHLLKSDPLLPLEVQSNANHLLGVVLDGFGQYAEAMSCLSKAKSLRRTIVDALRLEQIYDRMAQMRRDLLAELTPDTLRRWREDAKATPSPHPLTLVAGSPRSGTTLIEQILAAHPEIIVFDEPNAFASELLNCISPASAQGLNLKALNSFNATERDRLIGRYFKSLLRETEEKPGAKMLLDKNPSTTGALYIWLRLFPESKVVIALRDPRDIVISCYFQNIAVNWANVSFLNFDKTVKYYANLMDVWLRFRDLGGFDWMETRYEDVVANLEVEGKRVTGFLGLPWHDAQVTYYESARSKFVHSPTYNEVTKPVYKKAVGRWEHYAETLAPYQATLQPYLKAFGYA